MLSRYALESQPAAADHRDSIRQPTNHGSSEKNSRANLSTNGGPCRDYRLMPLMKLLPVANPWRAPLTALETPQWFSFGTSRKGLERRSAAVRF